MVGVGPAGRPGGGHRQLSAEGRLHAERTRSRATAVRLGRDARRLYSAATYCLRAEAHVSHHGAGEAVGLLTSGSGL